VVAHPSDVPSRRPLRRALILFASLVLALLAAVPAAPVAAAEGLTMEAHAMLQGHARAGTWMAIRVSLANDGPAIVGELRIAGGGSGRTQFGTEVDLPTGSRKDFTLYAQPPSFGSNLDVTLVSGTATLDTVDVKFALHEPTQLVIGIVGEESNRIAGQLNLIAPQNGQQAAIASLSLADLPDRVEAWAGLDRLIWQDIDAASLSTAQMAALRGWIAGGGRLIIAGGTAGPDVLAAFPDEILPYRPTATVDADPQSIAGLLGELPEDAAIFPAMAGELARGRPLAASGDRTIAAEAVYGTGSVTLLGFDPTTEWLAADDEISGPLWRRLIPPRTGTTTTLNDDGQVVSALYNLPSLALPPIGGLIALLFGYIVLVGPVNYLVLRWLDRREWAWVTIPTLIAVFTVGAFGFGNALRGSDVILHEISIVRGAPGTTEGLAWSYIGVFSPTRSTYQIRVPGGALISSPMSGDLFNSTSSGPLDVLQGTETARVRNLSVPFGSLRAVRAEVATQVPLITADLRLENGRVVGVIRNQSDQVLMRPAVVLGASAQVLAGDLAPGAQANVDMRLEQNPFAINQMSERIVGPVFHDPNMTFDSETQRKFVRRAIIDQLTYDQTTGMSNQFAGDSAMLLAWGDKTIVPMEVEGQTANRVGNVLYQVPVALTVSGKTTFRADLMRTSVVEVDAQFFSKEPWAISFGQGNVRLAFRPIPFDGRFTASRVIVGMGFGGEIGFGGLDPVALEPAPPCPESGCEVKGDWDGLPEIELRDRATGEFIRFPHLAQGQIYTLKDPARWVDPSTGELEARFSNERPDGAGGIGFQFSVQLEGDVQ
jgi:hypothetical protein